MRCNNCQFINDEHADYCGRCGAKLDGRKNMRVKPQSKKNLILLAVLIFTIFLGMLVVVKFNNRKNNDSNENMINSPTENSILTKITVEDFNELSVLFDDYKNNIISFDQYVRELAYSIFDYEMLNEKYKNDKTNYNSIDDFFAILENATEQLSEETADYIAEKLAFKGLNWEEPLPVKNTKNGNSDYRTQFLKSKIGQVNVLNRAYLSSNEHFLIYYSNEGGK